MHIKDLSVRIFQSAFFLLLAFVAFSPANAQSTGKIQPSAELPSSRNDPSADGSSEKLNGKAAAADALALSTQAAKKYSFRLLDSSDQSLAPSQKLLNLHSESVLRWSNPVAGEIYGNVFIWTHRSRPQVIGSLFKWYSPMTHGTHEFHSLSDKRLAARFDGELIWQTPGAGVEWKLATTAPEVADTPVVRLRQARGIARQIEIEKTDREGIQRKLRLLSQPIYRYADESIGISDGMLFVFVQGTDPEVFLMLESKTKRDDAKASREWHFAFARMNSVQFVAKLQNETVWQTEILPWNRVKNSREIYNTFGPFE